MYYDLIIELQLSLFDFCIETQKEIHLSIRYIKETCENLPLEFIHI